ncbi:MAG: major capsid protein [Microviridae sp.]|nr:MAG: major capsid protein [Microviridae sp.]
MHRNKSVNPHNFAMIPSAEIPRSSFRVQSSHKTTFNASYLIPIYVDEILPGDSINLNATIFARLATPIAPVMDNLHLDTFWFFVPNRLVWDNWVKMMGQQTNPGDSISYVTPQVTGTTGGYAALSIFDYMGLPTVGQVNAAGNFTHSALPLRAYNLIYNEWFRDENLQNSLTVNKGDGPDTPATYSLVRRGKRHDYFTSCLPWPQKGSSVSLPLGTTAPVLRTDNAAAWVPKVAGSNASVGTAGVQTVSGSLNVVGVANVSLDPNGGLYADLSAATAATINQLRQSFQVQRLLERDARGGTRYTEIVRSHFGVVSPDARLQRPEYLGGGSTLINVNPIAQTGPTGTTGSTAPMGTLAAMGTALRQGDGFSQAFTEHGHVIGLAMVRADLTYQQGMRKMWSRSTRYDYYMPVLAHLGEQAVLNKEIYLTGLAGDTGVFGYQERWGEYRYRPAMITGLFRSTTSGTVDLWHYAQRFTTTPTLNDTFISDATDAVVQRTTAVGAAANGQQFIADMFFDERRARPMPMYSVPGLIDHF